MEIRDTKKYSNTGLNDNSCALHACSNHSEERVARQTEEYVVKEEDQKQFHFNQNCRNSSGIESVGTTGKIFINDETQPSQKEDPEISRRESQRNGNLREKSVKIRQHPGGEYFTSEIGLLSVVPRIFVRP